MKERPILFSTPMASAIIDGTKTQTRQPYRSVAAACRDAADLMRDPGRRANVIRSLEEEANRAEALASFLAELVTVTP